MGRTTSQETTRRYERHQQSVEALDSKFIAHKLRFLLSLPNHQSILTNESMTQGVNLGIRKARFLLKFINNYPAYLKAVNDYIKASGQKLIK